MTIDREHKAISFRTIQAEFTDNWPSTSPDLTRREPREDPRPTSTCATKAAIHSLVLLSRA